MKVYIEDVLRLKLRILAFIDVAEKVLNERKEFLWSVFEMKNGKCQRVSLSTAKKRFKAQCIDRYREALDCLNSNDFSKVDWIDLRDVLYNVLYAIDMQGEKSMADLRQSKKDIIIEVYKDEDAFSDDLERFLKS